MSFRVSAGVRTKPWKHWKHATPYALFVHEGTAGSGFGTIRAQKRYWWYNPKLSKQLPKHYRPFGYLLPPRYKSLARQTDIPRSGRVKVGEVSGQKPQPFLTDAMEYVMAKVAK